MLLDKAVRALVALAFVAGASGAAAEVLRGEVVHRERIALPRETVLHVRVVDAARQDVAAEVLADARAQGAAGPSYAFALEVDPAWLAPPRQLRVEATLRAHGRALMTSRDAYPITPADFADGMTVVVHGTGGGPVSVPDLALVCRGNEPFWSLEIDGARARFSHMAGDWPAGGDHAGTLEVLDWAEPRRFIWRGGPPLGEAVVAVGRAEACLDTMADRPPYPWSVTLVAPGGRAALGCCEPPG